MPVGTFVNPEIIMGYKSPDLSGLDPTRIMSNVLAYKQAQTQQQANALALQEAKQKAADQALLQEAYNQADPVNYLRGLGRLDIANAYAAQQRKEEADKLDFRTKQAAYRKAVSEADKTEVDNALQTVQNQFAGVIARNPNLNTEEALRDYLSVSQQAHMDPHLGPILSASGAHHANTVLQAQTALENGTLPQLIQNSAQSAENLRKGFMPLTPEQKATIANEEAQRKETERHNRELEKAAQERISSTGLNAKDYPNVAQAIIDGRLAPNRVNSRNASLLEQTLKLNPDFDLESATATAIGTEAGARTLGTVGANQAAAGNEAATMIPIARLYADKVNAGQFKNLNDLSNWASKHTGDKSIVQLNTALNSLVNSYARAINPRGMPTVSDKNHAREILDAGLSNGQLNATLDVMEQEIAAARAGTAAARSEVNPGSKTTQAGGGAKTPTKSLDDIFKKKTP